MTVPGTLDPAMFSFNEERCWGLSFPTETTQNTCRIKSHLSWGIGLCTAAPTAMPKRPDSSLAPFHWQSLKQGSKGSLVTHFLSEGTIGPCISNRAGQTLQRRESMLNEYIITNRKAHQRLYVLIIITNYASGNPFTPISVKNISRESMYYIIKT